MFSRLLTKQNSHIIRSMHFVYANMNAFFFFFFFPMRYTKPPVVT